ncbi:MAG: succinate dehydrogenase iron-sulfur subunit [Candidatus Aminicenantes bacterium]|nr:succinate dehydrogenase iron-sulfur subunit [Candidatus Aminicenantes bacterium]
MKLNIEIKRSNPEKNKKPFYQKYKVNGDPNDRLLDVLMDIKRKFDPSLSFRKSCGHGVCGSDAIVVNGKERLACKTLIKTIADKEGACIRIEPLRTLPVQRDLMVDQKKFINSYRQVKPFFITKKKAVSKESVQSPEQRKKIDDATKCILCASCYSACPVIQKENPQYIGPASIVQAARFLFDSRDDGFEQRLSELNSPNGVWSCQNYFNCTQVCPRNIKVTKLINLTKKDIKKHES